MSWSISKGRLTVVGDRAQVCAKRLALRGVQAGRGLVEQQHPRACRERAGDPDQLAMALRQVGGAAPSQPSRDRTAPASPRSRAGRCASGRRCATPASGPGRPRGSLPRAGRRRARRSARSARAPAGRACAAQAGEVAPVEQDAPATGDETGVASTKVVLPAPFGPIRPTSSPSCTVELDVASGRARRRRTPTRPRR